MPTIIDYADALAALQSQGLKCHYYNSGAFGFAADVATASRGWIGPEDSSIREAARGLVRHAEVPFAERLTSLFMIVRREFLTGPVWVMPKSHWAFELEHGSSAWIPDLLREVGLDPADFAGLTNAAPIVFLNFEDHLLETFVGRLLNGLAGSDFLLVFTGHQTICTVHSHVQLWWTTADMDVAARLDEVLPAE